ncbi:uncharacterized protein METZ01_LOCUS83465 [marine metagenome]|uniref:Uncharacterized protein n=1 Tax=marine metagenome TaxID=408172 RepID=A0A381US93_9ZZZZ
MPDWLDDILEGATKYAPLLKTGIAAASTYASYQDQKEKNKLQQAAYDDYMRQVDAAGQQARAAIDINYTPMVVSGVPQTKADVTDFTAVAARGGLMNLPNRQRKRYLTGTGKEDIEVMEIDDIEPTPFDLQQETGIDLTGEQVQYDQGSSRQNAAMIWGNMGPGDKEPYNFDFEIFFDSGDWMDMIKSQAPVQGDMQMASDPGMGEGPFMMDEYLKAIKDGSFTGEYEDYIDQIDRSPADYMGAAGGIAGLRHGGRPGYANSNIDEFVTADTEGVVSKIPSQQDDGTEGWGEADLMGTSDYFVPPLKNEPTSLEEVIEIAKRVPVPGNPYFIWETMKKAGATFAEAIEIVKNQFGGEEVIEESEGIERFKKGGRIKKAPGGIMNLGGLEKDYRTTGGFVPIGAYEKKDDVPARLSKNEFVMTADAVRAAGGGSINKGAQLMYDTMKNLEARPQAQRMTA